MIPLSLVSALVAGTDVRQGLARRPSWADPPPAWTLADDLADQHRPARRHLGGPWRHRPTRSPLPAPAARVPNRPVVRPLEV